VESICGTFRATHWRLNRFGTSKIAIRGLCPIYGITVRERREIAAARGRRRSPSVRKLAILQGCTPDQVFDVVFDAMDRATAARSQNGAASHLASA